MITQIFLLEPAALFIEKELRCVLGTDALE